MLRGKDETLRKGHSLREGFQRFCGAKLVLTYEASMFRVMVAIDSGGAY